MSQPLQVLLVEDNPLEGELIVAELRRSGFAPIWTRVDTEAAFAENLGDAVDLVIADYTLPGFNALRALEVFRERGLRIPFIIVSGTIGEEVAVEAIRRGATDYVSKDRMSRLGMAVQRALAEFHEQRELRRTREELTEKLNRERALLRAVIDQIPDSIYVKDAKSRFLLGNVAVARVMGAASPEEIIGKTDVDFFPAAIAAAFRAEEERVLAGVPLIEKSETRKTAAGGTRHVQTTKLPLRDGAGKIVGLIGINRNVTSIQEARAALQESNARFQVAFEKAAFPATLSTLPDGRLVEVNEAFERMFGYSRQEAVGKNAAEVGLISYEMRERLVAELRARGFVREYEMEVRARSGEKRVVLLNSDLVQIGGRQYILNTARDITVRKRAETALRESEARMGKLFRASPAAICVNTVASGRLIDVNDRYCEFFGYRREEMIGRTIFELNLWGDPAERVPIIERFDRDGFVREAEVKFRRRSGEIRSALMSLERLELPGEGEPVLISMFVDVTARKRAEERERWLMRTYAVLSDINQMIVREREPQVILDRACQTAVEKGGFLLAWIGQPKEGGNSLRIAAHAGASPDTLPVIEKIFDDPGIGCVFTTDAQRTGRHAVCNDIAADPRAVPWRSAALERGYRAMVSLPIMIGGVCAGIFNLYANAPEFFDDPELRLLDELIADIAFALEGCVREGQRQQAVALLRASEERFRLVVENIREVFWMSDAEKNQMLYVSPSYEKVWGRTCSSLYESPRTWLESIHPDDRERVLVAAMTKQATGEYDERYRVVLPDGVVRWVRDRAFPVREASGAVRRIVGVAEDVTDHKQAEDALRESEAVFSQAFVHAPFGKGFVSLDGRWLRVNPALCAFLGFSVHDLLASGPESVVHPDDADVAREDWEKLLTGKLENSTRELRFRHSNGSVVWGLVSTTLLRTDSREPQFALMQIVDVTERKNLELQFLRAQRLEAVGTLASGVAHDLNNILAPMLMVVPLLRDKLSTSDDREILTMIEQSAERGASIIRQLLTFSRGIGGQRGHVQLRHLLREMLAMMRATFPREISVHETAPANLWPILADATQMHQMLMNLCVNARDAMPTGGRLSLTAQNTVLEETEVSRHPPTKPGRFVVVTVSDTGHGISPENLAKIFDPFFTTKEIGKGTGLGLSTVLGIVKNHGGFVTVYSEVDRGTAFRVYLPAEPALAESNVPPMYRAAPRGAGELILLADDEEAIRVSLRRLLEEHGYEVLTAPNGDEGMRLFRQYRDQLQLILTDLMMPVKGGVALIRGVREIDSKIKIIAMTGLQDEERQKELAAFGVAEVLLKPCTPLEVLQALQRQLPLPRENR